MNVVGLIVEPERRRLAGAEAEVGLGHVDREVQRVIVPVDADRDRELFGPGVRLFAAAVLVLQIEPQRLGEVEAIERAVERGRPIDAKGRARDRRGALQLEQRLQRGHRGARAGEPDPLRADLHFPSLGPDRVSLDSPSGLHLHDLPSGAHAADGGGRGHGLEHRDESGPATARAEYVERRFLLGSGLAEPGRPQQLSREQEVRSQLSAVSVQLEDGGSLARGHESLDGVHELVGQLALRPASGRDDVPGAVKMPRQLDQVRLLPRQVGDVHHVGGPRQDGAPQLAVAPPSPGKIAANVERQAVRIPWGLRAAVEAGRVVGQGRAIPEEVVGDVGSGPEVGQPVDAVRVEREVQPVGVPVATTRGAALEAHVAVARPQDREPLGVEQNARGRPGRSVSGELGGHLE